MTMEVILATALGRSLEIQDGKGGEVYENTIRIFMNYETDKPGLSGNFIALSRLWMKYNAEERMMHGCLHQCSFLSPLQQGSTSFYQLCGPS